MSDNGQIVFQELNSWLRHINNLLWTVTSLLLSLNFLAMERAINRGIEFLQKPFPYIFFPWFFISQSIALFYYVISLTVLTIKARKLLKYISLKPEDLQKAIISNRGDFKEYCKDAIKTPWALVTLVFVIFFIIFWVIISICPKIIFDCSWSLIPFRIG